MNNVHIEIPPISAYVLEQYLYGMDKQYEKNLIKCELFAISSYKNEVLTFKIKLIDGSLFDYVPPNMLFLSKEKSPINLSLKDLVYHNSPSNNITINNFDYLKKYKIHAFFVEAQIWLCAEYVCTVDWFENNENVHLCLLENNQIAFVPNHKCLFLKEKMNKPEFKSYKAIKQIWKI